MPLRSWGAEAVSIRGERAGWWGARRKRTRKPRISPETIGRLAPEGRLIVTSGPRRGQPGTLEAIMSLARRLTLLPVLCLGLSVRPGARRRGRPARRPRPARHASTCPTASSPRASSPTPPGNLYVGSLRDGDIWTVNVLTGEERLLVDNAADAGLVSVGPASRRARGGCGSPAGRRSRSACTTSRPGSCSRPTRSRRPASSTTSTSVAMPSTPPTR